MSGIYGIIHLDTTDIAARAFDGLAAWNKSYGCNADSGISDSGLRKQSQYRYRFGAAREFFKSCYASGNAFLEDAKAVCAADTLIYRRSEEALSPEVRLLTDEEYLFNIIRQNGPRALCNINGDFAGAYLDITSGRLLLFRDHMGVRPLFYYCRNGLIAFSTDIRGITSIDCIDADIDRRWLYSTLSGTMHMTTTETEYKYIKCVPPGGFVSIDLTKDDFPCEISYYWIPGETQVRLSSDREYTSRLRELISDAVKIRLDAIEGNIGAELSGGLDSSVIDILINRAGRECLYFSWIPDANTVPIVENDERLIIYDICNQEHIDCHYSKLSYKFGLDSVIAEQTPLKYTADDAREDFLVRYAVPAYMNTMDICNAAEYMHGLGAKVVFTGHGGDEGVSHRSDPYELIYHHEYSAYLHLMWQRSYNHKFRICTTLKKIIAHLFKAHKRFGKPFAEPGLACKIMSPALVKEGTGYPLEKLTFSYDPTTYIRKGGSRSRLDVVALFGAYNQIRYIAPYVDYRLIDYSLGIPRRLYLSATKNRFIFREAFKDIMPKSLYVLQNKIEISLKSYWDKKHEEETREEAASGNNEAYRIPSEKRRELVEKLDYKQWKELLDYDLLNRWIDSKKELETPDVSIVYGLTTCYVAQNMVKKSREFV